MLIALILPAGSRRHPGQNAFIAVLISAYGSPGDRIQNMLNDRVGDIYAGAVIYALKMRI